MGLFDKLRATLKAADPTVTDLQRSLNEANALRDGAAHDRARLAGQRGEMLTATDADRKKWKADLADADDRAADAEAFAVELAKRLAAAEAEGEQRRRREIYDAAKAKASAAARVVSRDYAKQCTALLGTLRILAEAQLAVEQANDELPTGAAALDDAEIMARGRLAQPAKILKTEVVERWCVLGTDKPLGSEMQDWAHAKGHGRGYLVPPPEKRGKASGAGQTELVRRRFRRTESLAPTDYVVPTRIATELRLPEFYTPPPLSPFGLDPTSTLALIDEALAPKAPEPERRVEVRFDPIGDTFAEAAE